jgi:hypothetical protein
LSLIKTKNLFQIHYFCYDILNKRFKKKITIKKFDIKRDYLKTNIIKWYDYIIYMITPKIFIDKKME